ncbi:hypothetical protein AUC45_11200 [Erythrobacter sp. YT30]|nr:hypothetical protein AUC45_11200 [Erythrobacter sp. YT30]
MSAYSAKKLREAIIERFLLIQSQRRCSWQIDEAAVPRWAPSIVTTGDEGHRHIAYMLQM